MIRYDVPTTPCTVDPVNAGKPLTSEYWETLVRMFKNGDPLDDICEALGRTRKSILSALRMRMLLASEGPRYDQHYYTQRSYQYAPVNRPTFKKREFLAPQFFDRSTVAANNLGWNCTSDGALEHMFKAGDDLEKMCVILNRSRQLVLNRLETLNLVVSDSSSRSIRYLYKELPKPKDFVSPTLNPQLKEDPMAKNIETKTFIAGVEAKDMTDGQVFAKIAELQERQRTLQKLDVKSTKLTKMIDGLTADIEALVAYVDGR